MPPPASSAVRAGSGHRCFPSRPALRPPAPGAAVSAARRRQLLHLGIPGAASAVGRSEACSRLPRGCSSCCAALRAAGGPAGEPARPGCRHFHCLQLLLRPSVQLSQEGEQEPEAVEASGASPGWAFSGSRREKRSACSGAGAVDNMAVGRDSGEPEAVMEGAAAFGCGGAREPMEAAARFQVPPPPGQRAWTWRLHACGICRLPARESVRKEAGRPGAMEQSAGEGSGWLLLTMGHQPPGFARELRFLLLVHAFWKVTAYLLGGFL
uniref:Uncharacterized protein n=1 Tax=Sphaerodactylus townsendi TaxID=933632 RepID=A0ACB8EGK8_9SAUR